MITTNFLTAKNKTFHGYYMVVYDFHRLKLINVQNFLLRILDQKQKWDLQIKSGNMDHLKFQTHIVVKKQNDQLHLYSKKRKKRKMLRKYIAQ